MKKQYLQYYEILGLQPGCSWRELKNVYRQLVKTWHPDHYDYQDKTLAEERIKEITKAYRKLSEYNTKHGMLPGSLFEHGSTRNEDIPGHASGINTSPGAEQTTPNEHVHGPWNQRKHSTNKSITSRIFRFLTICALIGIGFTLLNPAEQEKESGMSGEEEIKLTNQITTPDNSTQSAKKSQNATKKEKFFTVGSLIGEVIAIQGIPPTTEGNVWHYGKSKVIFDNGVVSYWIEDPSAPLKAKMKHDKHGPSSTYFTIGSTMETVRAAQGAPLSANEEVWDYGLSKVYFRHGTVTGWHESPMKPLNTRR